VAGGVLDPPLSATEPFDGGADGFADSILGSERTDTGERWQQTIVSGYDTATVVVC